MEDNWLVVGMLVLLVSGLVNMGMVYNMESGVSEEEMQNALDNVQVPSAQEIADLVVVPEMKEIEVPEFKGESMVMDLWKSLFSEEYAELEGHAYNDSVYELERRGYRDLVNWVESNIEGIDEVEDVDVDDYEVEVVELGLDDEDKVVRIVFEVEVEYTLVDGPSNDEYDKDLLVTAYVVYDEGDYSDEEVEFVYAFA